MAQTNVELKEVYIENRLTLNQFLIQVILESTKHEEGHVVFHIDAHSDNNGIEVNAKMIGWSEFFALLRPVNIALRGRLSLHLAACRAAWSIMSLDITKPTPFLGIIAPEVVLSAEDSIEIYRPFYHSIFVTRNFGAAVKALRREAEKRKIRIYTSTAGRLFLDGIDGYLENQARGRGRQDRLENMVSKLNEAGLDGVAMRKDVRAFLWGDQRPHIRDAWRIFTLIDQYPELESEVKQATPPKLLSYVSVQGDSVFSKVQ